MVKIWNSSTLFASKLLDIYKDFEDAFGYDPRDNMTNAQNSANETIKSGQTLGLVFGIIFGIVFLVIVIFIIIAAVKSHKKTSEFADVVKDKLKENIEKEKTKNVCPYCGTRLKDEDNRCPGCGAQRK